MREQCMAAVFAPELRSMTARIGTFGFSRCLGTGIGWSRDETVPRDLHSLGNGSTRCRSPDAGTRQRFAVRDRLIDRVWRCAFRVLP